MAKKKEENILIPLDIVMRDENAKDYKWVGTSLSGYVFTNYKKIVKLLGQPNSIGDAHKIDACWEFEMNDKVMTIYNYKDGKNYNGKSGLPVSKITEWHIGSADDVTEEVKTLAIIFECKFRMM